MLLLFFQLPWKLREAVVEEERERDLALPLANNEPGCWTITRSVSCGLFRETGEASIWWTGLHDFADRLADLIVWRFNASFNEDGGFEYRSENSRSLQLPQFYSRPHFGHFFFFFQFNLVSVCFHVGWILETLFLNSTCFNKYKWSMQNSVFMFKNIL